VLAPHTINLHIKDYKIERLPHKMGFIVEGCPAGKGMTDLPRLLEVLSPYKRCESTVLEQWVVPEPGISETVLKEAQWAREGLQYLRSTRFFEVKQYNIL
jgi:sugar phosphate isomerase/epimerase